MGWYEIPGDLFVASVTHGLKLRFGAAIWYQQFMTNVTLKRNIALIVGGLAIAGMGFTVGCSAKQAPAPTDQSNTEVDSKRGNNGAEPKQKPKNSYAPEVKAPSAPTAKPGDN